MFSQLRSVLSHVKSFAPSPIESALTKAHVGVSRILNRTSPTTTNYSDLSKLTPRKYEDLLAGVQSFGDNKTTSEFVYETTLLKEVDRTGWLETGNQNPESVAAHSWGVSILVLMLLPEDLDMQKALSYAIIHDMAEIRVGDIMPHEISKSEKRFLESMAIKGILPKTERGQELLELFQDYEEQKTPEARFVKLVDKLECAIQSIRYQEQEYEGAKMDAFITWAEKTLSGTRFEGLHLEVLALKN